MYREELESYLDEKVLTDLQLAFSRDQAEKVYVQHKMKNMSAKVWNIISNEGHFYVCGDAEHMAHDVSAALLSIFETEGKMTKEEAKAYFDKIGENRYHADVW